MKRLILLFALLCASPVFAANTFVVEMPVMGSNADDRVHWQRGKIEDWFRFHGADLDLYGWLGMKTQWVRTGVVPTGLGNGSGGQATTTYKAGIILGVTTNATWPAQVNGYGVRSDSLHNAANWPSIPLLIIAAPAHGCFTFSNVGTDSMGMSDCFADGSFNSTGSVYTTSGPYRWKGLGGPLKPFIQTTPRWATYHNVTHSGNAISRVLVGYATTPNGAIGTSVGVNVDSIPNAVVDPDSALVLVLMRSPNDPAPIIEVACSGSYITDYGVLGRAAAFLDSVTAQLNPGTGGMVFTHREVLPRKRAFGIHGTTTHSSYMASSDLFGGGGFLCPSADSCALVIAEVKAGVDSCHAHRIPITAFADPESITANGSVLTYLMAYRENSIGLEPRSGWSTSSITRASAAGRCIDPFGHLRARTFIPPGATALPTSCATDTGSLYCGLVNGFASLNALYLGRVDHVVLPNGGDWTPSSITSRYAPLDSIAMACAYGGATGVMSSPTGGSAHVGMGWSLTNGFDSATPAAPNGYLPNTGILPFSMNGTPGSLAMIEVRLEPGQPEWSFVNGHYVQEDFAQGQFDRAFYSYLTLTDFYRHNFFTRTPALIVNASALGGTGIGRPQRPGFWSVKWLDDEMKAVNAELPKWADGTPKVLDAWGTFDEVARDQLPGGAFRVGGR